jgi:hypothetical protein
MFFALWESRGYRISFVIEDSRYGTTASPSMPWICSILDFCNVRVNEEFEELTRCQQRGPYKAL